ncbi:MAG: hypothetical protein ABJE66_34705 [Deltaproteobacteria bacterium]
MRSWLLGLMLAVGCGKQLNPDYCEAHGSDPDCTSNGFIAIDAAPPCSMDMDCPDMDHHVCDTMIHACVQCTAADHLACTGMTTVCSTGDVCVGCTKDGDCGAGVCLVASNTCADSSTLLYASPAGATTGPCSEAAPCTLPYAVSIADATHHVIELIGNQFTLNAKLELNVEGLHLVPSQGSKPVITTPSGTVLHVTKSVEIDSMEIAGTNDDIIVCDGSAGRANLVLEQVIVHGSTRDSINSSKCNVTIERSRIYSNKETALWIDDAVINLRNSFIFSNGANNYQYAAVVLKGDTTGKLLFNTISYNISYDQMIGIGPHKQEYIAASALDCIQNGNNTVAVIGNLFIEDDKLAVTNGQFGSSPCSGNYTTDNLLGKAGDANFVNAPTDLHLTEQTPTGTGKVRDDGNTNCADDGQDIDGDARPQNNACDYGADELTATVE